MLRAGAASRDITPELKGDFFGYVRPDLRARGVALRLHAHALVLDDGANRVCLLTLDLGAPLVTRGVLARVGHLGYDRANLLVAATHTHAGPNRPGEWVAHQAAEAVRAAHEARRPARAAWSSARLDDANRSRSLEAHLANHGLDLYPGTGTEDLDPQGADHPRDVELRLLRVDDPDGAPLAAWAHFSAHPTTFGPANTYFSSDYPGAATRHFRGGFDAPPVAILTNGTEGDLIPRYDEVNQHALADRIGHRVATAMRRAWDATGPLTDELTVAGRCREVRYAGQEVGPGQRVGDRAWFGLPFLGGAQNGPSLFYGLGLEGRRRPRRLAGRVHGRKLVAAPAPWSPRATVTVLRVGPTLLLSVPGEPTVETGRRMVSATLAASDGSATGALVVGLAQSYRGYFTTPEEYDQQHYEGGHTVFGKHTSRLIEQTHAELARELRDAGGAPSGPAGDPPSPVAPPTGHAGRRPRVLSRPARRAERFETVDVAWRAPRRGLGRPVGTAMLTLERRRDDERWEVVDDDLGVGFVWRQRGRRCVARYELPGDLPTGRYRIAIHGTHAAVTAGPVEVVPSSGLRPIEARAVDGGVLLLAQHPPPVPELALRRRDRHPRGGRVRARIDGTEVELAWDAGRDGWWAPVTGTPTRVEVPSGGLVDGDGNHNGAEVGLRVGEAARLRWPANLGPGGGRPPGPFGLGAAGAPARR